jgi:hypothetical protein
LEFYYLQKKIIVIERFQELAIPWIVANVSKFLGKRRFRRINPDQAPSMTDIVIIEQKKGIIKSVEYSPQSNVTPVATEVDHNRRMIIEEEQVKPVPSKEIKSDTAQNNQISAQPDRVRRKSFGTEEVNPVPSNDFNSNTAQVNRVRRNSAGTEDVKPVHRNETISNQTTVQSDRGRRKSFGAEESISASRRHTEEFHVKPVTRRSSLAVDDQAFHHLRTSHTSINNSASTTDVGSHFGGARSQGATPRILSASDIKIKSATSSRGKLSENENKKSSYSLNRVKTLSQDIFGSGFKLGWTKSKSMTVMDSEEILRLPQYYRDDNLNASEGIRDEYAQKVIQYGYIALFAACFPIAPIFALMNNIYEVRGDAFKLLMVYQRPIPLQAENIGVWEQIIKMISWLSVLTNSAYIAFISPAFFNLFLTGYSYGTQYAIRLGFVLGFHYAVVILVQLFTTVLPVMPKSVELAMNRQAYLERVSADKDLEERDEDFVDESDDNVGQEDETSDDRQDDEYSFNFDKDSYRKPSFARFTANAGKSSASIARTAPGLPPIHIHASRTIRHPAIHNRRSSDDSKSLIV